jgi:hypothetical protein
MLKKVISGGQTGADRAGLIAAKACGIPTGGYINKSCKTELGFEPWLKDEFNLFEINSFEYPVRTLMNVQSSDATWTFYKDKLERGSLLTKNYCLRLDKPHLTINTSEDVGDLSAWLNRTDINIAVLNIAGNRESVAPGMQLFVKELLIKVFKK